MSQLVQKTLMSVGGPAGGNGGSSGNVWVEADGQLNSLNSFKKRVHYRAENGSPGGGSNMTGADAVDLVVKVNVACPINSCGTQCRKRFDGGNANITEGSLAGDSA